MIELVWIGAIAVAIAALIISTYEDGSPPL